MPQLIQMKGQYLVAEMEKKKIYQIIEFQKIKSDRKSWTSGYLDVGDSKDNNCDQCSW